jgi:hypothetical protein
LTSEFQLPTGERGPVMVEAQLPAGRWTTVAYPNPDNPEAPVPVDFPTSIGRAPIRNSLLLPDVDLDTPIRPLSERSFAIATSRRQPALTSSYAPLETDDTDQKPGPREPETWMPMRPGGEVPGPWDATLYYPEDRYSDLYGKIHLPDGPAIFPMREQGLAIEIEPALRVEPLSTERDPAWDTVVCLGQLDALDITDIHRLSGSQEPLLRGAAIYACYLNNFDEMLEPLIADDFEVFRSMPMDAQILRHAIARIVGDDPFVLTKLKGQRPCADKLNDLARRRLAPVFRWGVSIGCLVAEHYQARDLASHLGWIEERIVPTSTWTAWTPTKVAS